MMMMSIASALLALLAIQAVEAAPAKMTATVLDTTFYALIRGGDVRPSFDGKKNITLGAIFDKMMRPVLDREGKPRLAGNFDFTSYHKVPGNRIVSISQVEIGPAVYFGMELEQDKAGHLRVKALQPVDMSKWEGSVRPCAGSVSPWNTHLGGEENYPDVREFTEWLNRRNLAEVADSGDVRNLLNWNGYYLGGEEDVSQNAALKKAVQAMNATYIDPTDKEKWFELFSTIYKPYMIGHIVEITPENLKFEKHMALGRSSFEAALVMPDLRTVYLTDDSSGGGFMRFVCDKKGDFSKGTLYAAKMKQTNAPDSAAGTFTITWVKMADMDAKIVEEAARKPLKEFNFDDIFLSAPVEMGTCPTGYKLTVWEEIECLKLNTATPNVEMLAAGLETRRMIPYVGGTSEFSKWEGITLHKPQKGQVKLLTAISYQTDAMLSSEPEYGPDEIRVKENICGCTYALDLDKYYTAYNMYPQVCGKEVMVNGTKTCDKTIPANCDNADMMDGFPWLIISEDSGNREQCFTVVHNVDTKQNIIVAAAEKESEVTSGWLTDLGSYSYITQNYQGFETSPIGYLGPWKLQGLKDVTFKPHTPKGQDYVNAYAPYKEEL